MGKTSLKDRARKARSKGAESKDETPASTNGAKASKPDAEAPTPETTPKTESKASDPQAPRPADTADAPDNVVDIGAAALERLSDEQVNDVIAAHQAAVAAVEDSEEPFTAGLIATRETKAEQVQYDGKTPEGYVIRVWAPKGSSMLIGATLTQVS